MPRTYPDLNATKALIWRIVHRDNIPWILANGVHCASSGTRDPNFVSIGNADLIDKRTHRGVPVAPGGTLADYIPFYFTPFSPMMMNIRSGRNGVRQRGNDEIVILVSGLHHLAKMGAGFLFTDVHAYLSYAEYSSDLSNLDKIDWKLLQSRDFKRDDEDPRKMDRYQAEALVHKHLPVAGLLGAICYNKEVQAGIEHLAAAQGLSFKAYTQPGWYFS